MTAIFTFMLLLCIAFEIWQLRNSGEFHDFIDESKKVRSRKLTSNEIQSIFIKHTRSIIFIALSYFYYVPSILIMLFMGMPFVLIGVALIILGLDSFIKNRKIRVPIRICGCYCCIGLLLYTILLLNGIV